MPAPRKNASMSAGDGITSATDTASGPKRKRQPSVHTEPASTGKVAPIKVTLPSPASLQNGHGHSTTTGIPKVKLSLSPTKTGAKRQKISLKVNGRSGRDVAEEERDGAGEEHVSGDEGIEEEADERDAEVEEQVDEQMVRVDALGRDVRAALALVLAQMATNLPRPINQVLTLFLPPSFEQKESNTLAHILQQSDLTWERLVDLLHVFSTHLLQPASYPSPFPPLSHVHATMPPLPPHQPRHAIYDFCASLRDLMLSIEPDPRRASAAGSDMARLEKWALMMRAPAGTDGKGAGEWWTGIVDWRAAAKAVEKDEPDGAGLLGKLAQEGDAFGYAQAVSVASLAASTGPSGGGPRLGESLVRKASLKAQRWKETLAKRKGGFGSHYKPVTSTRNSAVPWTPGFAPSFDSHYASGGVGYWTTVEAMHQRNRYKRSAVGAELEGADFVKQEGYWGTLEPKNGGEEGLDTVIPNPTKASGTGAEAALVDNAAWLDELLGWQELRVRKGQEEVGKREQVVADQLLDSLSRLAGTLAPSDLTGDTEPGFAHEMSKRVIHAAAPVTRGTLDPRRRHAMHDNTTIKARPAVSQSAPSSSAPNIAQQLAGTPSRSANAPPTASGGSYTPTSNYLPRQQPQVPQSQQQYPKNYGQQYGQQTRQPYGYAPNQSTPTRPPGNYYGSQPQPGSAGSGAYRPPYPYNHHQSSPLPSQQAPAPAMGNTIYSHSRSPAHGNMNLPMLPQQAGQRQASASPMGAGGGGGITPLPGSIPQQYQQQQPQQQQQQYNRPGMGMMPSGLRQSFGPNGAGAAPGHPLGWGMAG